jgi:hypothetical protein
MGMSSSGAQTAPFSDPYQSPYSLPPATSYTNQGTTAQVQGGTAFYNPPSQPPQAAPVGQPGDLNGAQIGLPAFTDEMAQRGQYSMFGGMTPGDALGGGLTQTDPVTGLPYGQEAGPFNQLSQPVDSPRFYDTPPQGGLGGMLNQPTSGDQWSPTNNPFKGEIIGGPARRLEDLPGYNDLLRIPEYRPVGQVPTPPFLGLPVPTPQPITQPAPVQRTQPVAQPAPKPPQQAMRGKLVPGITPPAKTNPFNNYTARPPVQQGQRSGRAPVVPGRTDRPKPAPVQLKQNPFLRTR